MDAAGAGYAGDVGAGGAGVAVRTAGAGRSTRTVRYRCSAWRAHHFEVWSGELVCRAAALRVSGGLLLWLSGGGGQPQLGEVALGVPGGGGGAGDALATTLLAGGDGGEGCAAALARRLSRALRRPVHVCVGAPLDRLALPLVERALAAEIRNRPECF